MTQPSGQPSKLSQHGVAGAAPSSRSRARRHWATVGQSFAAVMLTILVLAGCGRPGGDPHTPAPVGSASPTVWNPQQWRSPFTPAPITLSPSEQASRRTAYLRSYAADLGIKAEQPPALVRWIYPEEMGKEWTACLVKAGWTNSYPSAEGGIGWTEPPKSQESAFKLEVWRCAAQYSIDPRLTTEATPDMLKVSWFYLRDYGIPCLTAHGYAPDGPLPTEETYVATGGDFLLYPSGLHPMPELVRRECPQGPPSKALLGD